MKTLKVILLSALLSSVALSQPIKNRAPEGKGGDSKLNVKKNRTDSPNSTSVKEWNLSDIVNFEEPQEWTSGDDRSDLEKEGEGTPIQVTGFLLQAKQEGKESYNCSLSGVANTDLHLAIASKSTTPEAQSIIAEITPRVKLQHHGWTKVKLNAIVSNEMTVRVTRYLLLGTQHINNPFPRASNWEIHPITELEVEQNGKWVSLDDFTS